MARRPAWAIALASAVAVAWLAALTLHVDLLVRGRLAWLPLYASSAAGADAFPVVEGLWPDVDPAGAALRPGDRLRAVGERSLRGASRLDVLAASYAAAGAEGRAVFTLERGGAERRASLALRPIGQAWRMLPLVAALAAAAGILGWRRPGSRAARACALACAAYGLTWTVFLCAGGALTHVGFASMVVAAALFPPLTLRAILLFPDATARAREPLWPWLFAVEGPLVSSWLVGAPLPGELGLQLLSANHAVFALACLAALAFRYRASDAPARRQLRWVLLGFYLALAPIAAAAVLASLRPALWPVYEWSLVAALLVPASLAVALLRSNLFDLDRLISATAAFSLLLVVFLGLLFTLVPVLSQAAGELAGVNEAVAQPLVGLVLAAALLRGERALRPRLERVFFRERHVFERGAGELREALAKSESPGALFELLGERLRALLALETCALYARSGAGYVPVFVHGTALPTALGLEEGGALAALLEEADRPVDRRRLELWLRRGRLAPLEAAQLAGLDPRVLVPLHRGDALEAVLCLGEKGSGDVYTPLDLALLDGIRDRVGVELARFDAAAIERAERERYRRLQSYVPEAVRGELEHPEAGAGEPGEREVTVLFVDIRGYTSFSEGRSPDAIFRVVNAYTRAVSGVVQQHRGWVVEFQGDGLMAVFGAPVDDPAKERAAVTAARAIVARIEAGIEEIAEIPLRVGVGVATGPAYVGNVQSVDRRIWCVIGNTTNLAARLQSLTRQLGTPLVIDAATHARAGDAAEEFLRKDEVRIRGRSEPMTLYLLPATA